MNESNNIQDDQEFDICPACKNKIPQGAIACTHCKAHQVIQYNFLGKILVYAKKLNIGAVVFFLLYLFAVYNHTYVRTGLLYIAIICFIPQILLWVLPKDKYTKKVWVYD